MVTEYDSACCMWLGAACVSLGILYSRWSRDPTADAVWWVADSWPTWQTRGNGLITSSSSSPSSSTIHSNNIDNNNRNSTETETDRTRQFCAQAGQLDDHQILIETLVLPECHCHRLLGLVQGRLAAEVRGATPTIDDDVPDRGATTYLPRYMTRTEHGCCIYRPGAPRGLRYRPRACWCLGGSPKETHRLMSCAEKREEKPSDFLQQRGISSAKG